jgi:hypothetical protein
MWAAGSAIGFVALFFMVGLAAILAAGRVDRKAKKTDCSEANTCNCPEADTLRAQAAFLPFPGAGTTFAHTAAGSFLWICRWIVFPLT